MTGRVRVIVAATDMVRVGRVDVLLGAMSMRVRFLLGADWSSTVS